MRGRWRGLETIRESGVYGGGRDEGVVVRGVDVMVEDVVDIKC